MAKKKQRKKEQFNNSEPVVAYGEAESLNFKTTLGKLKQQFMAKKLPYEVKRVMFTNYGESYFIHYNHTKGFKYERL